MSQGLSQELETRSKALAIPTDPGLEVWPHITLLWEDSP